MNWKINYWTVLFALAVIGLAYQAFSGGKGGAAEPEVTAEVADVQNDPSCPPYQDYMIPDSTANERILRYKNNYAGKVQAFAEKECNTLNGGVSYFALSKCELEDIAQYDSVHAYMSLIPGAPGAMDTLDLLFQVFGQQPQAIAPAGYYDFTKPCPPCLPRRPR